MRKIEFRGQVLHTTDWVRGNLLTYLDELYLIEYNKDSMFVKKQVNKDTIGQFMNLSDKNNNEICEGDIVIIPYGWFGDEMFESSNGVVIYDEDRFIVDSKNLSDYKWSELEVIGNKYDNPELLKNN